MRNGRTLKIICSFVLLFCFAGLLHGCKQQPQEFGTAKSPREPLTIGVAMLVLSAPILIAYENGYFAEEGLNVTLKEYQFGKLALEDLFAGKVDLATVAETPIVMYSFEREDYFVVAEFVHSYDDSKIIVRNDRGIRNPADLKGKKIGTTFGTSAHFFAEAYLSYNKVKRSDIKLLDIPQKDLAEALKQGEVDAIAAFEPHAYEAMRHMSKTAMRLPRAELLRETFDLVSMKEFTKLHPDTIRRALKAIDTSVKFIRDNKGKAIAILARRLNADEEYLHDTWDDFEFGLSLDQTLLLTFEDVAQWAIRNKLTDKTQLPNYLHFIYFGGMESLNPEAVRIIRQ
jgi:NitT/TauT family transport system substrate-binding protein